MFISENTPLLEAMSMLDKNAQKILFVVDKDEKLLAALTDGDIRRWILSKGSLDAEVKYFANYSPKYLLEEHRDTAKQFMLSNHIEVVPIVRSDLKIVGIERAFDVLEKKNTNLKDVPVVINAGGLGTRLYPYTKILPKPLIPVGDSPIIEHIINNFDKYGCRDFYIIVNHKKNMIKAYFNELENNYSICFIDEENPLGTGGGLSLLKNVIDKTFFFTNCDVLINDDMEKIYKQHKNSNNTITIVCSLKDYVIPYGAIELAENGLIAEIKEKPRISFIVNTGVYVVEPIVVEDLEPNQPIDFPDLAKRYIDNVAYNVGVFPVSDRAWMDMGQFDGLDDMTERFIQNRK